MAAGCTKVYREKASGARGDRAELAKVLRRLEPDDVLVVTRLDRLARSTRDLLNVLAAVAERAGFRSLKDAWADTTTPHGRLMLTSGAPVRFFRYVPEWVGVPAETASAPDRHDRVVGSPCAHRF
jgi:hypothetical protein